MSKKDGDCGVAVGVDAGVRACAVGVWAGAGAGAGELLSSTHASIEKKSPLLAAAAGLGPLGAAAVAGAVVVAVVDADALRGALGEPDTSAAWLYGTKFCPHTHTRGKQLCER